MWFFLDRIVYRTNNTNIILFSWKIHFALTMNDTFLFVLFPQNSNCCAYGKDGMGTKGYDCVVIPGAQQSLTPFAPLPSQFCGGNSVGLVTQTGDKGATICSEGPFKQYVTLFWLILTLSLPYVMAKIRV